MRQRGKVVCSLAAGALLLTGCVERYTPPPVDFESTSFTQRKSSEADKLLEEVTELSLAQAQAIAIKNNPNYISAYYAVNAAKMRYYQALGAFSPTLDASFGIGDQYTINQHRVNSSGANRTNSFFTSAGLQANWVLFEGGARYFAAKIAEASENATKLLQEDDCRVLIRNVAYAYNEILLQKENMRIAQENMKFQRTSLQDTEIKHQAGAVPLSDVLNFQIYVNTAEGDWITAQYQLEVAVYALAVLMGYPEGTLPSHVQFPEIDKEYLRELPSVDLYLDSALKNRPDLKNLREQMVIADYQLKQTYSAYSPTISAYADLGFGTNLTRYYGNTDYVHNYGENWSVDYGLQANWQLFNGLIRYNQSREAMALLAESHYQVANTWLTVVSEVRNAYANYLQSVRQVNLYVKTLELTAKQRDLVEAEYRAGTAELTRLNEAQRDLVDAETQLASSYINVHNAKAQLEAAAAMNTVGYYEDPTRLPEDVPLPAETAAPAAEASAAEAPAAPAGK